MPHVWRLEVKGTGDGVYWSGAALDVFGDISSSRRHPMPHMDGLAKWRKEAGAASEWRFGFASLDQYRKWFNKQERAKLAAYEDGLLTLREFEVPAEDVRAGHSQVVFLRRKARVISEQAPNAV